MRPGILINFKLYSPLAKIILFVSIFSTLVRQSLEIQISSLFRDNFKNSFTQFNSFDLLYINSKSKPVIL